MSQSDVENPWLVRGRAVDQFRFLRVHVMQEIDVD